MNAIFSALGGLGVVGGGAVGEAVAVGGLVGANVAAGSGVGVSSSPPQAPIKSRVSKLKNTADTVNFMSYLRDTGRVFLTRI